MQASQPSATEIVLTRAFAAPPERIFAAITRPEHLRQWLGTREHTMVECSIDLQVGGKLSYVFQRPSGRRIEVRGTIQAVEPPCLFSYLESYDFSPLQVRVTTTLSTTPTSTLLQQTLVYATRAERDADFDGVFSSSQEAYARLAELLTEMGWGQSAEVG